MSENQVVMGASKRTVDDANNGDETATAGVAWSVLTVAVQIAVQ